MNDHGLIKIETDGEGFNVNLEGDPAYLMNLLYNAASQDELLQEVISKAFNVLMAQAYLHEGEVFWERYKTEVMANVELMRNEKL